MPNLPSAEKRVRQSDRDRTRNRARKSVVRTETRKLLEAVLAVFANWIDLVAPDRGQIPR